MFAVLSKTLFYLMMPAVWITILLLWACFTKKETSRRRNIFIVAFLFIFLGNDFIINEIYRGWEPAPIPLKELPAHDYAIVLTGVVNANLPPGDRVHFSKGADRVLHTVQLYKEKKISKIIITGGSGRLIGTKTSEAPELKKVFLMCGVPEQDILIEKESFNTHENALLTKRMIDSLHISGKFILVTSAFHMTRSVGCFTKEGIVVTPYPVDFYQHDRRFTLDRIIIPNEGSQMKWALIIHEWVGVMSYKLMGYL